VFSMKCKSYGIVDRYKTRLVTKGYTHTSRIDSRKTFTPMAKMNTVRVILSFAFNID
jgi:hypothetical protein